MIRIPALLLPALFSAGVHAGLPARDLADFTIGINCHRFSSQNVPLLRDLGISSGRIDVVWRDVGTASGEIRKEAERLQLIRKAPIALSGTLGILCYGHPEHLAGGRPITPEAVAAFGRFCSAAIRCIGGLLPLVEVWNEWDVAGMGGTPISEGSGRPEDYVRLLEKSYTAIKKTAPGSVVLGGAMGGIGEHNNYLQRALKVGLLEYCDGLSIHPYFYGAKTPEARLPENAIPERLNKVKAWLSSYTSGERMPIYVTEIGWPTYSGDGGVHQEEQARNMVRSLILLALEERVKGVWIYELRDGADDPLNREHHFGLVTWDGRPKPSYYALKDLISLFSSAKAIERVPSCGDCFAVALEQKREEKTYLAWAIDDDKSCFLEVEGGSTTKNPILRTLGRFEFDKGEVLSAGVRKTLGVMPLVITDLGDKQNLKIAAAER